MKLLSPDAPFAPRRWPFYYGWWIVAVATLGMVMSIPGQTMGVSVFTDPLLAATGLSRLELATAYLLGTLGSSLLLPLGGTLVDRRGSRAVAIGACVALGITLAVLTRVGALVEGVTARVGERHAIFVAGGVLTLGFLALRLSGQGLLTMASRTMLQRWFDRRRGLAAGVSGVFVSFGFAAAPPALDALIDLHGWRGAWLVLAAVVGAGMSCVAWLFFRETPESCGLSLDGRAPAAGDTDEMRAAAAEIAAGEPGATRSEALRTAGFWWVTLPLALHAMAYTGITFHVVDLGVSTGLGGERAVRLFLPVAFVSTSTGLFSGWIADRVPVRPLVLVFLLAQAAGYVGAGRLGEPLFVALTVAGWGVAGGIFGTLVAVAVPRFFGRRHLGAIASVQMSCMVAGSAGGPALLAAARDALGSYVPALVGCCALALVLALSAAIAPSPESPRR